MWAMLAAPCWPATICQHEAEIKAILTNKDVIALTRTTGQAGHARLCGRRVEVWTRPLAGAPRRGRADAGSDHVARTRST